MKLITAPKATPFKADLFLAGGISNCPNWQQVVLNGLKETDLIVLNPRREFYSTETSAREQIKWEYDALRTVSTVLFWFPEETLCPITLFELGVFSQKPDVKLVVGTHPNYARRLDVVEQLKWSRPEVEVVDNLSELLSFI
jgi:hypothetical protein